MRPAATLLAALALLVPACAPPAAKPRRVFQPGDLAITIYSGHSTDPYGWGRHAVVKECRAVDLPEGISELKLTRIPQHIDATSLRFVDLTDPTGTRVLEQNYRYDLYDRDALLKRSLGRRVELTPRGRRRFAGKLLAASDNTVFTLVDGSPQWVTRPTVILQPDRGGIDLVGYNKGAPWAFRFANPPRDLATRPTLAWTIQARKGGKHNVLLSYETTGLAWRADYAAVLSRDDTRLDLSAWATITNTSGARFANARIKLIPDVVTEDIRMDTPFLFGEEDFFSVVGAGAFEAKVFNSRFYALPRPVTLEDRQSKQIELIAATDIPVRKIYTYDGLKTRWRYDHDDYEYSESYGTQCRKTVRVNVELDNTKAANLGIPLPGGILRVYKRDDDASLEFIGEDCIDHMPAGETARLYLGDAFDIVGERVRIDHSRPEARRVRESFQIEIRNHKPTPVTVHVLERLYRGPNWTVEKHSAPFTKLDSHAVEFPLKVPANGEAAFTYTVLYSYPHDWDDDPDEF